jgi:hypothetical protein
MPDPTEAKLRARELRALGHVAAMADDAALARLVLLLDQLADRGEADQVLAAVRPRVRALRLPRRLSLARLLFLPLDGAIRAPGDWTRGEPTLPRSVLTVLAGAVLAALGPEGEAIATGCAAATTADAGLVAGHGGRLWPRAAEVLPAAPPPGWAETGLLAGDYAQIAALCRPVWAAGPAIWAAIAAAEQGPPDDLVRAALGALLPSGTAPLAAALATLMLRANAPGAVAQVASTLHPDARPIAVRALEAMLEEPPPPFGRLDPRMAAEAALAAAQRLDDLERCPLMAGDRQRQVAAWRRQADEGCRASFLTAVEDRLMAPTVRLLAEPVVADSEVATIESGVRQLRALETAGRKLGGAQAYDRALRGLTETMAALGAQAAHPGGLQPMDLARSIEILAGPDAAEAVLATLRAPPPAAG